MTSHEEMVAKYGLKHLPESWVYKRAGSNKKCIQGFGINDVEFATSITIDGKRYKHPAYVDWISMFSRCFTNKCKVKYPTYIDVTCCEEWLKFSKFLSWWEMNYTVGYSLDKDLLIRGNKIYSPTTSLFITVEVNSFLNSRCNDRGNLPLGVTSNGNKFRARVNIGNEEVNLGSFSTKEEAHKAWQQSKLKRAKELKQEYNLEQLQYVINRLQADIDENKITEII